MTGTFDREPTSMSIPVFVINGFLESGKTQFMKFTMQQGYFQDDRPTLLVLCEEGEEEYDEKLLKRTNTHLVVIEDQKEMTVERLHELELVYDPGRVLIEWNGIWNQDELEIPENWFVNQVVTLFDTSTMDLYLKNMKSLMGPMLRHSELVLCNRADDIPMDTLGEYHFQLRTMASNAEIVFEGREGEIRGDFSIELPYDLDADVIKIEPEDFGIFYMDSMERSDKYNGKSVEFAGQVVKPRNIPKNSLVVGRRAMTCCEADMQFLGFLCYYPGADSFHNKDWVKVKGKIKIENVAVYRGEGAVIEVTEVLRTGPIQEIVTF